MLSTYMRILPTLLAGSALPVSGYASAQTVNYPERPVTLVVGFAPGGTADTLARLLAPYLTDDLGHSVVVENKSGATSNIAAESVARSTADGHTLFLATTANAVNRSLYRELGYDLVRDFVAVGMLASVPNVLVVHPDVPARNLQEYISYAKANPKKLSCASSGIGSTIHMSCELFKMATGTEILHVPYRGNALAIIDLLSGRVTSMFDNLPSSLPHIHSGKLRAIGVTARSRDPMAPDIPTLAEAGLPDFAVQLWFGLLAPAGTRPEIISRLNDALRRASRNPELRQAYARQGYTMPDEPASSDAFEATINADIERWERVVKATDPGRIVTRRRARISLDIAPGTLYSSAPWAAMPIRMFIGPSLLPQ